MGRVFLLDCTLRDGGYINDWHFGENTIRGFCKKIALAGIDICEVGFIKGDTYDPDKSLFPDSDSFKNVIFPKSDKMKYVGMLDMGNPIPLERLKPCDGTSIDGIRVIFKKDKINQAYEYCKEIMKLGYFLSVNFVGTDLYSDKEFVDAIEKFNEIAPHAVSIVDSFGVIKRKHFLRLVYLADNNLKEGIALAYHAHNNLQQAFGNAEALVEMNLKRDIIIDACVFGMGRGAGNLNLELFAEYMNENYDTEYRIEPMLEIMDEYLNDIYKTKFWGYSLPLYLSASMRCHPNYAIYLAEKDSLTVKGFREILGSIDVADRAKFNRDKAEIYYKRYLEHHIEDDVAVEQLTTAFYNKKVVVVAPGKSLNDYAAEVYRHIEGENTVSIALNFLPDIFKTDYIFSSNMRRYSKIEGKTDSKCIITSNVEEAEHADYVVNFSSYAVEKSDIIDNSGLMLLNLLVACGVRRVYIAGMDGYSSYESKNYINNTWEYDFSEQAEKRNILISEELKRLQEVIDIHFITPTKYTIED